MNLILCGFPGCGKSTFGAYVAKTTKCPFIDTDVLLRTTFAHIHNLRIIPSCKEIAKDHGEMIFRMIEKKVIMELDPKESSIIALGGGSVIDPENVKKLKSIGKIIYLKESVAQVTARIERKPPASFDLEKLDDIIEFRYLCYEQNADHIIDISGKSPEDIVQAIVSHFR